MNILTVMPLAKGIPRDELSYFSARDVAVGTLVTVPFGGRKIRAVVVDHNPVRDLKASIKTEKFKLKNVLEIHTDSQLPHALFAAAQQTGRFFAQPIGAIIETMVPKVLFEYYLQHGTNNHSVETTAVPTDMQIMQIPHHERIAVYKTMIRENLAKRVSTMIIVPTVTQAELMATEMKTGIEDRIVVLHGKVSKGKIAAAITQATNPDRAIVTITTPSFACITRNDWNTIIIDESSSPYYRYEFGPRFDMGYFIEKFAKTCGASRFIYADTLIDINLRARASTKKIYDARSTWHITKPEDFKLLDMRPAEGVKKSFGLFHPETELLIKKTIAQKSKLVLLANRKGLAPLTVCSDCGTAVTCPHCETPLVLHRTKSGTSASRTYICHHCLQTTVPIDSCASCGGSRLALLGISTDRIFEELSEQFPDASLFMATDDETTVAKTMKAWNKSPSGILIGTHAVLPYITTVPYGAIVSFDSLLSHPAYTSAETSLCAILNFLEKISDAAIIQTRNMSHDAVAAIANENIFDFVRNEIDSRTMFGYPPAKVLVKISLDAKKSEMQHVMDYYETIFKAYDPDILMKKSKKPDNAIIQAIMKIDPAIWNNPESQIQTTIRELSREFVRDINPDSVI